jgi:hypothetical protein
MANLSIYHVATCLSCYLQDHHNRPGELLLGVPVDGNTTYQDILDGLESEWNAAYVIEDKDGNMIEGQDEAFPYALKECFSSVTDMSEVFNSGLDSPDEGDDDMGESCYAWFVVSADLPDSEEES